MAVDQEKGSTAVFFQQVSAGGNLSVTVGDSEEERLQRLSETLLRIPERQWLPDRSPPGALLRADYGVVPFHGRQRELQDLKDWATNDSPIAIRLYTGAGGMGKTRLALEVCKQLRDQGWRAGFIDHRRSQVPREAWRALVRHPGLLFLVLDYAETCRNLLIDLLHEVNEAEPNRIRVVLLARAAGDWWEKLKTEGEGVGDLVSGPATFRFSLGALAMTVEERKESYWKAAKEFAKTLGKLVPTEQPDDFDAPHFERVLLLHMTALAAVDGIQVKGADGILDYILKRERRFWVELAQTRALASTIEAGIGRAMAAITLGGGVDDEQEALGVLQALSFFKGQTQDVLYAVVRLLHDSYPGEKWIEPVQPDLLGEHLVQMELNAGADELLDLVLGARDI